MTKIDSKYLMPNLFVNSRYVVSIFDIYIVQTLSQMKASLFETNYSIPPNKAPKYQTLSVCTVYIYMSIQGTIWVKDNHHLKKVLILSAANKGLELVYIQFQNQRFHKQLKPIQETYTKWRLISDVKRLILVLASNALAP